MGCNQGKEEVIQPVPLATKNTKIVPAGAAKGGAIPNSAFTESSNFGNEDTDLNNGKGRLHEDSCGWAPSSDKKESLEEWLQVDLGKVMTVAGV